VSLKRLVASAPLGWLSVILLALACRVSFVSPGISAAEYVGWIFLLCVPPVIALIIGRSRSSGSIAHVLYDAEQAGDRERR
jgi:multisubunit Na+/H+ antiporter MnhG subunit